MAITKYESYYKQIKESVKEIQNENDYDNLSKAFIHWYLKNHLYMEEQEIGEVIIDGPGDNGIDVIVLNESEKKLTIMQFKFPDDIRHIDSEIKQADIEKTFSGFSLLIDKAKKRDNSNLLFNQFKEKIKDIDIYDFHIYFISFNKGVDSDANRQIIQDFERTFKKNYGSDLKIDVYEKSIISNIYEKINRKNNLEVTIPYIQMPPAYDIVPKNIKSFVGLVNGIRLIQAIEDNIETIFDENIRLYEGNTNVNSSIKNTASNDEESEMFYFYNNGITIICNEVSNSPNKLSIYLKGVSIVNGCQTVTSLYNLYKSNKLKENVGILIRIIQITDYNERMKITEYLNSQNPIKDSYFIANHTIIRDLQKSLEEKGYYLERQINEFEYRKNYGDKTLDNLIPIKLENIIQYYVGYWLDDYASTAKRGKSSLFDKSKIDEILMDISADKVIEANNMYKKISEIITSYRKTRRNNQKSEFSKFLGIENSQFLDKINEYLFINNGDIIILNTVKLLKDKYTSNNIDFDDNLLIKKAIFLIHERILTNFSEESKNVSALTKNNKLFRDIKNTIESMEIQSIIDIHY